MLKGVFFIVSFCFCLLISAQQPIPPRNSFVLETQFHAGVILRNSGDVPKNSMPFMAEINPSFQTNGREDWHQIFRFPRVGCGIIFGSLGNRRELGSILGFVPNITFKSTDDKWFTPSYNFGLGIAYFNKPYNEQTNPTNFYIGSHITALGQVSVQIEPKLSNKLNLIAGVKIVHCSNSHYQVPNLGINVLSFSMGLKFNNQTQTQERIYRELETPPSKLKLNARTGVGVHEFARTFGPAGTPKYSIYITDVYLSKRYGKVSNIHAGVELKYYNSFYNFIVTNDFLPGNAKMQSTVITAFMAHELMIKRVGFVTQVGYNLYNKFYKEYIKMWKSEQGLNSELKKHISTRLGVQYYFFDPKYCTQRNVFIGAYIKANLGMADFACMQLGVVF